MEALKGRSTAVDREEGHGRDDDMPCCEEVGALQAAPYLAGRRAARHQCPIMNEENVAIDSGDSAPGGDAQNVGAH